MIGDRPLRFHWSLSQAGNTFRRSLSPAEMTGRPDFPSQLELCRVAERSGIDSMLMALGSTRPDPTLLSVALGREAHRIGFMIACRPGLVSPTAFVQQFNTASQLLEGRVSVNIVIGHTPGELGYYGCFLGREERFDQADEFLTICRELWARGPDSPGVDFQGTYYQVEDARVGTPFAGRGGPEIFFGGNSRRSSELSIQHASCSFRFAEPPSTLAPRIAPILEAGKEVGLLVSLLGRTTRAEAVRDAEAMVNDLGRKAFEAHLAREQAVDANSYRSTYDLARGSETGWATDTLWLGAVPYLGAPAVALVGSADEIASAILEYRGLGVSQFLFMGWPDLEEMTFFGREVLPRVRQGEREAGARCA
jgi:alkanesulfonate monooxygenase